MILVDTALKARAEARNPVRFALIGAGFMGRGIVNQVLNHMPGIDVPVICNRTVEAAIRAYTENGVPRERVVEVTSAEALARAMEAGRYAVTDDPAVVCAAEGIEAILEVTGHVEHGARVTVLAIEHGKHVVLMNAELDATVGPLLKRRADAAGVILTGCDGDQPAAQMNLLRFVRSIGLTPRVCGNIKGLQDRYRTPATQAAFARQWGQTPEMVTSFADGTKISFEQALVANATGMQVAQRGMLGLEHRGHVDEMTGMYDLDMLRSHGGIVDYALGALPSPGIYVFAEACDAQQATYLNYGKLGEGPLYSFYTPYHLCHFEVPLSVARAVLFDDPVLQPLGAPRVDVVTTAKVDLRSGDILDGIGRYRTYGQAENADVARTERLLPMGLSEGCRMTRDLPRDSVLTYHDVEIPDGRLQDKLRAEQDEHFFP
jgi:predicted homoserine dehydrogenase-like protein